MNVFAIVIGFQAIMTFGGIWPGPSGPAAAESFGGVAELVELGEDVTVSRTVTEITLLRAKRPKRWETGCARV